MFCFGGARHPATHGQVASPLQGCGVGAGHARPNKSATRGSPEGAPGRVRPTEQRSRNQTWGRRLRPSGPTGGSAAGQGARPTKSSRLRKVASVVVLWPRGGLSRIWRGRALETDPHRGLELTRDERGGGLAKIRIGQVGGGRRQVDVIESVESFDSKLQLGSLRDREVFRQG